MLLLFDGFAPQIVDAFSTPALDRMGREGTYSHALDPVFPSISLTNGITISTGCQPGKHGVVSNRFIDPERGLYDHAADADWLTGCEHIHETAERQGVRTAAMSWVGRHSETRGQLASVVWGSGNPCDYPFEEREAERAAAIRSLLVAPDRPGLILGYFCGPDGFEHFTGMESEETRAAVERSDAIVAGILETIDRLEPQARVSLLVTTDHGMVDVTHVVNIARILRRHEIDATPISSGTSSFLYFPEFPDRAARDAALDAAMNALSSYDAFSVFRKDAPPTYARLGNSPRVGDLVVSAHPPYFIEDLESWPSWLRWLGRIGPDFIWSRFTLKATHGYAPGTPGVAGVVYAWGDGVSNRGRVGRVRNIDLHPTVTTLLGIEPGPEVEGRRDRRFLETP